MNPQELKNAIFAALTGVRNPQTGKDILEAGQVRDLEVSDSGEARFAFALGPKDPGGLVKEARAAAAAVPGVESVKVNVELPRAGGDRPAGKRELQPGSVPAPTPKPGILKDVRRVIAVSSGKGGVGKSMIASNLAAALAASGQAVGLLDADVYGPNIPIMFGESRRPAVTGAKGEERIEPLEAHGVRLMSLGFLLEKEQPAIMRGPLIAGVLKQFIEQVAWGTLDALVVDMPPGTGDAQLSLVQTIDLDGAVLVSTPQEVSTGDVRRAVKMFERVNTRVLGIVENMSGLICPHCDETIDVFGSGGAEALATEMDLPFLGRVPLDPRVRTSGDAGKPAVLAHRESPASEALRGVAREVWRLVEA